MWRSLILNHRPMQWLTFQYDLTVKKLRIHYHFYLLPALKRFPTTKTKSPLDGPRLTIQKRCTPAWRPRPWWEPRGRPWGSCWQTSAAGSWLWWGSKRVLYIKINSNLGKCFWLAVFQTRKKTKKTGRGRNLEYENKNMQKQSYVLNPI